MRAVVIDSPGSEDQLVYREVPDPIPAEGEVLVRVRAAGVNRGDLMRRAGRPGVSYPLIIGWDIAGIVEDLGPGVDGFSVGQRVVATTPQGGYAELCSVPVGRVAPLHDAVDFIAAAALPVAYLTALLGMRLRAKPHEGETVVIQAGASGVGVAAIQLACLAGARVIATAGSEAKLDLCRRLGATRAVDYRTGSLRDAVDEVSSGRGADVVVESVGGEVLLESVGMLAVGGRLVMVGNTSGEPASIDLLSLVPRHATVSGFVLALEPQPPKTAGLVELVELVASGWLKAVIDRTLPLAEAATAHRVLGRRENAGKVVLVP